MPMQKKKRPSPSNRKGETHRATMKGNDNQSKPTRPKKDSNREGTKSRVATKRR
jgi:hypothetical protein